MLFSLVKVISHLLPLPTEESSAWYTAAQMSSDCKNAKLLIKLIFAAPLGTHALLSPQSSGRECRGNTGLTPDTTSMLSQVTRPLMLERDRNLKSATFGGIVGWGNF